MIDKTEAQLAHEARNTATARAASERKAQRIAEHQARNQEAKTVAILNAARDGKGIEELTILFAPLAYDKDWRFDVDAAVDGPMSDDTRIKTIAAIAFFTCADIDHIGVIHGEDETLFFAEGFWANGLRYPRVSADIAKDVEAVAKAAGFAQED